MEGSNPLLSFPDTQRWLEAREQLDLLVVIEPTMTETALVADYILPTPTGYEKWEMASFPRGYPRVQTQLRPPILPAPGEALPEGEIYNRLAEAMGLGSRAAPGTLRSGERRASTRRGRGLSEGSSDRSKGREVLGSPLLGLPHPGAPTRFAGALQRLGFRP